MPKLLHITKKKFENTDGETFLFVAQDMHLYICPPHFKL